MPNPNPAPFGGAYTDFPDSPEAYREATTDGTLRALFRSAVAHAESRIDWYSRKSAERAGKAKGIRRWSLIFFALGTMSPVFLTLLVKLADVRAMGAEPPKLNLFNHLANMPYAEIGYLLLALAGALVVFDQFFDASGSWMRFRQSEARLQVLLAELRYGWAELLAESGGVVRPGAAEFVKLLRDFVIKVELLAEAETRQWAQQFRTNLEAFDRNPNLQVRIGESRNGEGRDTERAEGREASTNGAGPPQAGQRATSPGGGTTVATPAAVNVRLAVDGIETLDVGSLVLTVHDTPVSVPADGFVELALEPGVPHRIVATGAAERSARARGAHHDPDAGRRERAAAHLADVRGGPWQIHSSERRRRSRRKASIEPSPIWDAMGPRCGRS